MKLLDIFKKDKSDELLKVLKLYDEYLVRNACWIGEDGSMAVWAKTKERAFSKFKKLMKSDVGDSEVKEMDIDYVKPAYFRLPTEEDIDRDGEEFSFYVSESEPSDYFVWKYL